MPRKAAATTVAKKIENPTVTPMETVVDEMAKTAVVDTPDEPKQYRVKNKLDPHAYIVVRNGFNGKLIYKSGRTGEKFTWDQFGDEQEIELQELKSAKNSSKAYFENNWFLIDDPEVITYLGVERYYRTALTYDGIEGLFDETPKEIAAKISKMPEGQRQTVIYRAKHMIAEGEIDSIKVINALESSLGVELIER